MMLIEMMKPDFVFEDERGSLRQLVQKGFSQYNIIFSKKRVLRGNHFHKKNKEAFYVISGAFTLNVSKDGRKETYQFKQGDMFLVPPNVVHSFYYTQDCYIASMYDIGVENKDGSKDIYTE